jgi:hypothetical protein
MANDNIRANAISVFIAPQTDKSDTTNLVFDEFFRTGGAPVETVTYETSAIIDDSGQAPEQVKTGSESQMDGESEYKQGDWQLFKKAIHGDETVTDVTGSDISFSATGIDSGASNAFADLIAGDHFWITGSASNDGMFIIETKLNDNEVETTEAPAVESAGASVTVFSRKIKSGVTRYYDAVQKRMPYDAGVGGVGHQTFINGLMDTAQLTIPATGIVTESMTWLLGGKLAGKNAVAGQSDSGNARPSTMTSDNVSGFWLNDASEQCQIRSADMSISNNYETSDAAGCSAREFGKGSIGVTASLVAYTNSADPFKYEDYASGATDVSFAFGLKSNDELTEVVYKLPNCKVTTATPEPDGNLLMTNFEVTAQGSKAESTTINIYVNQ